MGDVLLDNETEVAGKGFSGEKILCTDWISCTLRLILIITDIAFTYLIPAIY